jgi:hypothetical protein
MCGGSLVRYRLTEFSSRRKFRPKGIHDTRYGMRLAIKVAKAANKDVWIALVDFYCGLNEQQRLHCVTGWCLILQPTSTGS